MSDKVAERWGDAAFTHTLAEIGWMSSKAVLMHLNERATGNPARDWLSSWAHRWFPGHALRVLVLGCGEGWLERAIAGWPFIATIDAVDFAADAVARARAMAPPNVRYEVADLNHLVLPQNTYDVVVAHMVLHHVERLEHAFEQIARTMKPEATLIVNEYVGPKRFQFSDAVLTITNELLRCLPPRLRRSALEAKTYESRERPPEQLMIDLDPSEAVRSDELLPMLEERFEILDRKDIGGALLQHLLYDIVQNFRFDAPKERAMIDLLCILDGRMVDCGAVQSDFVICAARKRGSAVVRIDRPLPPLPEGAKDLEADPLTRHRRAGIQSHGSTDGALSTIDLRMLRVLLASAKPHRANLFRQSVFQAALERLRFAAARTSRYDWLRSRFRAYADPADEDDAALLALLSAIHSIR